MPVKHALFNLIAAKAVSAEPWTFDPAAEKAPTDGVITLKAGATVTVAKEVDGKPVVFVAALHEARNLAHKGGDAEAVALCTELIAAATPKEASVPAPEDSHEINGVEVFRTGTWNGDAYTRRDLDDMVEAFGHVGFTPPVKLGHFERSGEPAYGWVKAIRRVGERLLADLADVPASIYNAIKSRRFDAVSSEIFWNVTRGEKTFRRAFAGVAILGSEIPAVANLKPLRSVVFGLNGSTFASAKVYTVNPPKSTRAKLTNRESPMKLNLNELKAKRADLKAQIAAAKEPDAKDELRTELDEVNDQIEAFAEEAASGDPLGTKKVLEEVADLRKRLELSEADKRQTILDSKVAGIRIPSLREHFTALYRLATDPVLAGKKVTFSVEGKTGEVDPVKVIDDLAERLNKHTEWLDGERGATRSDLTRDDEDDDADAGDALDRLATEYMTKHPEVKDYGDAFAAVCKDNPKLSRAYNARNN